MTEKQFQTEFLELRKLMESRDFWLGDKKQIESVFKGAWQVYIEAPLQFRTLGVSMIKEMQARMVYMDELRLQKGLETII